MTNEEELALGTDPRSADSDGDARADGSDNCPLVENPDQRDEVHPNDAGDACDDPDVDGVADLTDNCVDTANPGQGDRDRDGRGDACDAFPDLDLVVRRGGPDLGFAGEALESRFRLETREGRLAEEVSGARMTLVAGGSAVFGDAATEGVLLEGGGTNRVVVEFTGGVVAIGIRSDAVEDVRVSGEVAEGVELVGDVFEDFEGDDGGLAPTAGLWERGVPTSGPGQAFSGAEVWATSLAGDVPRLLDESLVSQVYPLAPAADPALEIQSWFGASSCCQTGHVEVRGEGEEAWQTLDTLRGALGGYTRLRYDLGARAGSRIQIRFRMATAAGSQAGWYLDDFFLTGLDVRVRFLDPLGDLDGDGLTNAAEASAGTDLRDPDSDGDSVPDGEDNCPVDSNFRQRDLDGDGVGRICDDFDGEDPGEVEVSLEFGEAGFDLELDPARGLAYVSIPDLDAIASITPECQEVETHFIATSRPHGLDLSRDGTRLVAASNGAGSILAIDPRSFDADEFEIRVTLGSTGTYDAIEALEGQVFASSDARFGFGYIAGLDLTDGQSQRVANRRGFRVPVVLQEDAARRSLYAGIGSDRLWRLDLTRSQVPIVRSSRTGSVSGTDHLAVSPDGDRVALRSGQILRSDDFVEVGRVPAGVSQYAPDRDVLYVAQPDRVEIFNARTLAKLEEVGVPCPLGSVERLAVLPGGGGWLVLGGERVCGRVPVSPGGDPDGDGLAGRCDNCPDTPNTDQIDGDGDGLGDVCDDYPELDLVARAATRPFGVVETPSPIFYRLKDRDGIPVTGLAGVTATLLASGSARFGTEASEGLLLDGGGTSQVRVAFVRGRLSLPVSAAVPETIELSGAGDPGTGLQVVPTRVTFLEAEGDPDGDGLTNAEEVARGSNPRRGDTDQDGVPDAQGQVPRRCRPGPGRLRW